MRHPIAVEDWKKAGCPQLKEAEEFLVKDATLDDVTISDELIRTLDLTEAETKRAFPFTISGEKRDRHGDRVDVGGWNLKEIQKNPVVPWSHNYHMPPLGSMKRIWRTHADDNGTRKLRAIKQFAPKGMYPFADMIHDMVGARILRMASVGFLPEEWEKDTEASEEELKRYWMPVHHKRQELMESSIVMIGSYRDALQEAKSVGITTDIAQETLEHILDTKAFAPAVGLTRENVEGGWKAVREEKFYFDFSEPENKEIPVKEFLDALKAFEEAFFKRIDERAELQKQDLLKAVDGAVAKALEPKKPEPQKESTPDEIKAGVRSAVKEALGL